eukprot:TRINITY_DN3842_c0_g2_i1.p1 TRINITY_DN3842_c0_g2~~TRINITY_DN3842_c0_g2_i1.p1  ORF type:complete len:384 (-),score=69.05 TRINITY_DN3842_c0_g2_i1:197-1348(-)
MPLEQQLYHPNQGVGCTETVRFHEFGQFLVTSGNKHLIVWSPHLSAPLDHKVIGLYEIQLTEFNEENGDVSIFGKNEEGVYCTLRLQSFLNRMELETKMQYERDRLRRQSNMTTTSTTDSSISLNNLRSTSLSSLSSLGSNMSFDHTGGSFTSPAEYSEDYDDECGYPYRKGRYNPENYKTQENHPRAKPDISNVSAHSHQETSTTTASNSTTSVDLGRSYSSISPSTSAANLKESTGAITITINNNNNNSNNNKANGQPPEKHCNRNKRRNKKRKSNKGSLSRQQQQHNESQSPPNNRTAGNTTVIVHHGPGLNDSCIICNKDFSARTDPGVKKQLICKTFVCGPCSQKRAFCPCGVGKEPHCVRDGPFQEIGCHQTISREL